MTCLLVVCYPPCKFANLRVFSVNNTSIDSLAQSTAGMGTSTTTLATAGTATSFQRQASSSSQNAVQVLNRSIRAYFFEAIQAP